MNVLYAGLDNPINVSVPGVAQKDVIAVFDGPGVLQKKPDGTYFVRPTTKGTGKVKVSAKVDGGTIAMGEMIFRVKRVPTPVSTLDGIYTGGAISLPKFKSTNGVVARLDNFDFPVSFKIVSYTITILTLDEVQKIPCVGSPFDAKFKEYLKGNRLKKGVSIFFDDIVALGPEGEQRNLPSLAFNIASK
jgi:hypothetical protein